MSLCCNHFDLKYLKTEKNTHMHKLGHSRITTFIFVLWRINIWSFHLTFSITCSCEPREVSDESIPHCIDVVWLKLGNCLHSLLPLVNSYSLNVSYTQHHNFMLISVTFLYLFEVVASSLLFLLFYKVIVL